MRVVPGNGNSCAELSAGEGCYLVFLAVLCGLKALGFYEGQSVFTIGMGIALVCLLLKIGMTRHTPAEYAVIAVLLGMGLLVYRNTGEKSLLINLAVLVGMKEVSLKRAFRVFFAVWGSCYTLLTFLSLAGLHSDVLYMHNKHGLGYVICHSMGYAHSNVLHINYLCISAMILYLVKDSFRRRQKLVLTALLAALNLYVFLYSMSFTGVAAGFLFYAVYVWLLLRGRVSGLLRGLSMLLVPALALFFLAGPILIRGKWFDLINKALNTRYNLTRWFLTEQPITAFGTRFRIPNYRYTLDCSYAYLFMQLGVVPFAVLLLLYVLTIRRLAIDQRRTELAMMIGLCIAGGTEPFLFNLSFKNVTLLLVGEYLFRLLGAWERRGAIRGAVNGKGGIAREQDTAAKLRREYVLLPKWADRPVPGGLLVCDGFCRGLAGIYHRWQEKAKGYGLLFLLCCAVGIGAAALLRSPIHTVYINSSVNEEEERTSQYITPEERERLTRGDALIYGYVDATEKMYPYGGSTAALEYVRILISSGLWCGMVCCVGCSWIQNTKANRNCVQENELYREKE